MNKIEEILKTGLEVSVNITTSDLKAFFDEIEAKKDAKNEPIQETYPTVKEVCKILKKDKVTLWRWAKKGYLVPISIGGSRHYRMGDIEAILKGQ